MEKKLLLAFGLLLCSSSTIFAQSENTEETPNVEESNDIYQSKRYQRVWQNRKKYFNFNYSQQELKIEGADSKLKSDWGAGISTGRTYYLHKRPILGMIKFGLDWTYFDLNVGSYSIEDSGYAEPDEMGMESEEIVEKYDLYKMEAGMHFGPSITINPVGRLKVAAYFHVVPSYSAYYIDSSFEGNYATYFTYGASVSYGVISIGAEQRWGDTKIKSEEDSEKIKYNNKGARFYLSFRF